MYALAERSQGHEFVARVGPLCPDHGIYFVFVVWLAKTCVNPLQRLVAVDSLSFNTRLISNCAGEYSRPDIGVFLYAKRPSAYLVLLLMLSSLMLYCSN